MAINLTKAWAQKAGGKLARARHNNAKINLLSLTKICGSKEPKSNSRKVAKSVTYSYVPQKFQIGQARYNRLQNKWPPLLSERRGAETK